MPAQIDTEKTNDAKGDDTRFVGIQRQHEASQKPELATFENKETKRSFSVPITGTADDFAEKVKEKAGKARK